MVDSEGKATATAASPLLAGMVYDGAWRPGTVLRDAVEPGTGKVIGRVAVASVADVAAAAGAAAQAQRGWAAAHYDQRGAVLRRAAAVAEARREEITDLLVRESGSTPAKAGFEVAITIKALLEAAGMASQPRGVVLPSDEQRISIARRLPLGVVGVISPFNFPLYLAMRAVAPALAVGNAVVLKPDLRTAICGGAVLASLFDEAGLTPGVLHMLPGGVDVGEAMCGDPHIAMIQFTGSTAAGRRVGEIAGRNLKKVSLELGGKNALIVLDDADLDLAVANASWGTFLHQGQICMATGRVLVHHAIADTFARRLAERAGRLSVGDPAAGSALGPLISAGQVEHASDIVRRSVAAGATLTGGGGDQGYFSPAILTGVTRDMPAFNDEIFAPVAVVVPFADDNEAVALANEGDFGLSAGIITRSIDRALEIGRQLRVGLLHINDQTVNDDVVNPFGGFGASGNGTSIGGPANWEEFTQWQWLTMRGTPTAYPL